MVKTLSGSCLSLKIDGIQFVQFAVFLYVKKGIGNEEMDPKNSRDRIRRCKAILHGS